MSLLRNVRRVVRVLAGIVALACAGRALYNLRPLGPMPAPSGAVDQSARADWARLDDAKSGCSLVNNVWNKASAGRVFEQEIFARLAPADAVLGWRWRASWQFLPTVISQPELVCGTKPWDEPRGGMGLESGFPFQVDQHRLTAEFEASLHAVGTYNLAFSMWVVSSLPAHKDKITHEIMVWIVDGGQPKAGTAQGSVDASGVPFDLYVEKGHGDAAGKESNRWTYAAFVARTAVQHGPLELSVFLDRLVSLGMVAKSSYVTSLELGNEVDQGVGVTELRGFSVRVH